MWKKAAAVSCLLVGVLAAPASARDVPLTVQWTGEKPQSVKISDPTGDKLLTDNGGGSPFRGLFSVSGPVQLGAVTIQYGSYYHTFQVRLNPRIQQVVLQIDHHIQKSCTHQRVHNAKEPSDTPQEATMRAVNAGELLNIQGANACDKFLKFYAAQAKYMQTAKLVEKSSGEFLMDKSTEEEYRAAALERGIPVDMRIAANETKDGVREVRRLVDAANRAKAEGNYRLALDIDDFMEGRIEASQSTANFYKSLGVTQAALDADSNYLRPRVQAQTSGGGFVHAGERGER